MSYTNLQSLEEIKNKKVLFYDLETTGLVKTPKGLKPEEEYPDFKDKIYDDVRIVSIGWFYTKDFNYENQIKIENISERIIKPEGFIIPEESIKIHGITNEDANTLGKELKKSLKKFGKIIKKCDYIIGYNIFYDINVLLSELHRKKRNKTIEKILKLKQEKKIFCLGQLSAQEAKPDKWRQHNNYKFPSQKMVYKKCFNQELENVHNAKYDILATINIMFWIYENKNYTKNLSLKYDLSNLEENANTNVNTNVKNGKNLNITI